MYTADVYSSQRWDQANHPQIVPLISNNKKGPETRRLRSAFSVDLTIPTTRRFSLGDRAFAVASPRVCVSEVTTIIMALYKCLYYYYWNTLPDAVWRCSSPDCFKRLLKTHLYIQC